MERALQILGVLCGLIGGFMLARLLLTFPGQVAALVGNDHVGIVALGVLVDLFLASYPLITAFLLWRSFSLYAVQRLFIACVICGLFA